MKKIIFFFTLILATAIIYGYNRSGENELAGNNAKQAVSKDLKENTAESDVSIEYYKQVKGAADRPNILLILTADKSKNGRSVSFLRNYLYPGTGQDGC